MKKPVILTAKAMLKFIYFFLKLLPTDNRKLLFCSRQGNELPLDFRMIQEELVSRRPGIHMVSICKRIEGESGLDLSFIRVTLRSMYHMATCRVCILDSYWPAASMLEHKKNLKIIQIWHSIGKIKKSGLVSVGKKTGRSEETARLVNMHENNDYIIGGAKAFDSFYYDSFGDGHYRLLNYGLPRIDYLIKTEDSNRRRFFSENPELKDCTILLYAPTFRRGMEARWAEIIGAVDDERYALIVKNHPSQRINGKRPSDNVYYFDEWKSLDLLAVSDYVITDYSAIALEAAVLSRKTCYWVYDYDEFVRENGLNVDMYESMPGTVFRDANKLMDFIKAGDYPMDLLKNYREKYLPKDLGQSARKITDLILDILNQKEDI